MKVAVLEAAENDSDIMDEVVQNIFKKNGRNMMAVIFLKKTELAKFGVIGNFYVSLIEFQKMSRFWTVLSLLFCSSMRFSFKIFRT